MAPSESTEGGWGYVVSLSLSLIYSVTTVPLYSFGLVFSDLLEEIDAVAYGPSLSNGIYNTVLSFTGLATSHLLQKYSCRDVCLLGAVLFFLGSGCVIFSKNLLQFIFCYGILQGIGFGLMMPACLTAFNSHFTTKRNFMMALCQAAIVSVTLAWPTTTEALLRAFGWKGTQAIFAALSLNCLAAGLTFRQRRKRAPSQNEDGPLVSADRSPIGKVNANKDSVDGIPVKGLMNKLSRSLDLGLFLDPVYVNTAIGLSMSYTSDFMFISLLPMIAISRGYTEEQATSVMTIHFTFDLICNLFLPILNRLARIRNRYLFLGGTITSAIARTCIGFGLMMPACLTAFNSHFTTKRNFMMALCQAAIVSVTLAWPTTTEALLRAFGWKGTQAIFAALSLNCLAAGLTFRQRRKRAPSQNEDGPLVSADRSPIGKVNANKDSVDGIPVKGLMNKLSRSLDLGLFLDPVYVNTAIGLSMSYTSDFMFISLLPMIAISRGYTEEQATSVMTIHFTFDLICNLFLPILNRLARIRNRYLFLGGTITSAIARTCFVMDESFVWMGCCVAALGFLRSFIQTPLPLVIAESYGDRFTTAFSLYMVVCGCVTLIYGPLIGLVNSFTEGYTMVVHTLTAAHLCCAIPWLIELIILARKS